MVAGRRLWGHNEQDATQHQTGRRRDLGIEAVVEDRLGTGETRGRCTRVQPGGQIDQKDDREAERSEGEDDSPQPAAALVAQRGQGESGGKQRHRDQQVGMGLPGGLDLDGRGRCSRQAGVARLADLDRAVVGELGGDQEGGGGDDRQADCPLRREYAAGT
ncbi:MAG: hypothetical protein WA687_09070, partial [Solirubrobacterales bacterium]